MNKAWSHLPNAEHIDWVLETLKKNQGVWNPAGDATWDAARDAARDEVCDVEWRAARDHTVSDTLHAARDAMCDDEWRAMYGSIYTLIAWDDSSELLDMSVKEVTELATQGNHAAVLLLPAVIVKNKLKEKNKINC